MQLRLLVLEEVSPRPRLKSLGDFHRELEFFERPDRQSIVREVYERFQRQSGEASVDARCPHAAPRAAASEAPPSLVEAASRATWGAGCVSGHAWRRGGLGVAPSRGLMAEGSRGGVLAGRIRFGRRGVGLAREGWAEAGVRLGLSSRPSPPPSPVKTVGKPMTAAAAGQAEPGAATPTAEAAPLPPGAGRPACGHRASASRRCGPQPETGQPLAAERPRPARVYSAADPDVVPPRLIRPTPAAAANAGVATENPTVEVDVVVSATGTVESARLIPPGSGPRAATMISAVKAWTFEPATLGGEPVRYRYRLRLPAR